MLVCLRAKRASLACSLRALPGLRRARCSGALIFFKGGRNRKLRFFLEKGQEMKKAGVGLVAAVVLGAATIGNAALYLTVDGVVEPNGPVVLDVNETTIIRRMGRR